MSRNSVKNSAARVGIVLTETCIIGNKVIGLSDAGRLYQFDSAQGRWLRLETSDAWASPRQRRLIRYRGDPNMAVQINA